MVLPALVIVEIFLECLACLCMHRFVCNIWVLFVSRALVIFGAVTLPIAQAHPAEIVFTTKALHVIAATILLDANVTLWTIFCVSTNVVGRLAVVRTLC